MRKVVGIDRKIKRAWLDATLDRFAQEGDDSGLRSFLNQHLKDELPGKESRAKTSGVILRIWSGIPPERTALRNRAVALLPRISGQERIWLHWGMTALAYPFFRDTAEVVGRLLALQDDFTTAQVQARMLTSWGDRATSKEAAQKLVTMLVDWGVLRSTKTKGHFLLARKMTASIPDLQLWLLEALLGASAADEIEAQQLLRLPEAFPFSIGVGLADFRRHEGFNIHRQGLDMDMVAVRKMKPEPLPNPLARHGRAKLDTSQGASPRSRKNGVLLHRSKKPPSALLFPITPPPTDTEVSDLDNHLPIGESISKQVRASSALEHELVEVPFPQLTPADQPFASPSAECEKQLTNGHYFSCIALAHAVIKEMIVHVSSAKVRRRPHKEWSVEKHLEALHKNNVIDGEWRAKLHQVIVSRHGMMHLRPSSQEDQSKLDDAARDLVSLLNDMKAKFFEFTMQEGNIIPDHPELWPTKSSDTVY